MRRPLMLAALAAGAAMALWIAPSSAMQRLADPSGAHTLLTRVADMDRGDRRRRDSEYWHYRLGAARWLSYQHVNAGYPAHPDRYAGVHHVYLPGTIRCWYRRHWPWMGRRHWHGPRYWIWMGHRHHHHW